MERSITVKKALKELTEETQDPLIVIEYLRECFERGFPQLEQIYDLTSELKYSIPYLGEKDLWNDKAFDHKRSSLLKILPNLKHEANHLLEKDKKGEMKIIETTDLEYLTKKFNEQ